MTAPPLTVKGVCLDGDGRLLAGRNPRGEWELPGGRPEAGETPAQTLAREFREETGLAVRVRDQLLRGPLEVVPGRVVELLAFGCEAVRADRPLRRSAEHIEVAWIDPAAVFAGYRAAVDRWLRATGESQSKLS